MLKLFNQRWNEVPTCWLDVETTGTIPGGDQAVQVALVRFENGAEVGRFSSLLNPGRAIPAEVTALHGIGDEHVRDAPSISEVMGRREVRELLAGSQLGAYNAEFDRRFLPALALCFEDREGWRWPWFDSLSWIRIVDRFAKGPGRHKLAASCERHGVILDKAHDAASDARAAGELFYKIVPKGIDANQAQVWTVGEVLRWQRECDVEEWYRFTHWLSRQPPRPEASP